MFYIMAHIIQCIHQIIVAYMLRSKPVHFIIHSKLLYLTYANPVFHKAMQVLVNSFQKIVCQFFEETAFFTKGIYTLNCLLRIIFKHFFGFFKPI